MCKELLLGLKVPLADCAWRRFDSVKIFLVVMILNRSVRTPADAQLVLFSRLTRSFGTSADIKFTRLSECVRGWKHSRICSCG
jgi:hypothetical protein